MFICGTVWKPCWLRIGKQVAGIRPIRFVNWETVRRYSALAQAIWRQDVAMRRWGGHTGTRCWGADKIVNWETGRWYSALVGKDVGGWLFGRAVSHLTSGRCHVALDWFAWLDWFVWLDWCVWVAGLAYLVILFWNWIVWGSFLDEIEVWRLDFRRFGIIFLMKLRSRGLLFRKKGLWGRSEAIGEQKQHAPERLGLDFGRHFRSKIDQKLMYFLIWFLIRYLIDFWSNSGGFLDQQLIIFGYLFRNSDFMTNSTSPIRNHHFQGSEAPEIDQKSIWNRYRK